jgi:hypothetical protein
MSVDVQEELFVDTSRNEKMRINVDIDFPKMPCAYLSMDVMDVSGETEARTLKPRPARLAPAGSTDVCPPRLPYCRPGEHELDIDHDIVKQRLDMQGEPIASGVEKQEELGDAVCRRWQGCTSLENPSLRFSPATFFRHAPDGRGGTRAERNARWPRPSSLREVSAIFCVGVANFGGGCLVRCHLPDHPLPLATHSCYGAETEDLKCCNTCEQVREAYRYSVSTKVTTLSDKKLESSIFPSAFLLASFRFFSFVVCRPITRSNQG